MADELIEALQFANKVLDSPHHDPDALLVMLARQLVRLSEAAEEAIRCQTKTASGFIHITADKLLERIAPFNEQMRKAATED